MNSLKILNQSLLTLSAVSLFSCSAARPPSSESPKKSPASEATQMEAQKDPRYAALPEPTEAPNWSPPHVEKTTLENGLTIWQMAQDSTPLVSIHLMLSAGSAFDPTDKAGLTLLTADMLDEGAGKYSALELSDRLGELATDYSASTALDYTLLSMDALTENLEASLELLSDIVLRPRLSRSEFERRKKHHLANALTALDDPSTSRQKALARVLFGEKYGGLPSTGNLETLERIAWSDMKKHQKLIASPVGAHLVVAGKAQKELIEAAVQKHFGSWRGKALTAPTNVQPIAHQPKAFIVDFPGAAQSSLAVATRAGSDADPNYFAEEVMNEKFSGSFTGRINMNLREDKGYTYGAGGGFRRYKNGGYFAISSNVKSEVTGASIQEILNELKALCAARPLSEAERNDAVHGMLLGYPMTFDQISSMGYRLVSLPIHNRPADYWTTWPSEVKKISTQRANEAASPYCDSNRYSIIIAGDTASITPQLLSLGLGVSNLDRNGLPVSNDEKVAIAVQ